MLKIFKRHNESLFWLIVKSWLPLAVLATATAAMVYVAVQQNYRQSVNDPQIQLAEDATAALAGGQAIEGVVPSKKVDLRQSLAFAMIVFDQNGRVVAGSANLDGQVPSPPAGVFNFVRTHGQERFTWEPDSDVRQAAVIKSFVGNDSGFVLVSRSLREVEKRESELEEMIGLAWLATLGATLLSVVIISGYKKA